ncbi:hypothetical protein GGI43DRAFT_88281 [Trichoderma evansii]
MRATKWAVHSKQTPGSVSLAGISNQLMHALFLGLHFYKTIDGPTNAAAPILLATIFLLAVFFSSLIELAEEREQRIPFLSLISACSSETHPFVLPC